MAKLRTYIASTLLITSLVFLTSCSTASETSPEASLTRIINTKDYQMQVFTSWEEIANSSLDTVVSPALVQVFQSMQPIKGIYSKLSIIKEELLTPISSLEYADRNILNTPKITQNYTKLQSIETTIAGERTLVHIYQGQSTALSPLLLFIQTFLIHEGSQGYTVTFSISPSVKDTAPYLDLLETLRFTVPESAITEKK